MRRRTSRTSTRRTSTSSRATRRSRARSRTSLASWSTTRTRSRSSCRKAQGPGFAASLIMPVTTAGAEGVRGEVRQGEPVDVQRARRLLRPVHGRERRVRASSSATRPASRSTWFATRTGTRSLDFRPAYLDEITLTTNATDANVAGRQVLSGQNLILDTNPPAQVLKRVVQRQKDQLVTLPGGGFRWFPLNIDDQAAGQHQRPQGDPRRVRPHRRHQGARRLVRRQARHALHPAGHPAGSTRPVARRAPGSTSWPTRRATWPWPRST